MIFDRSGPVWGDIKLFFQEGKIKKKRRGLRRTDDEFDKERTKKMDNGRTGGLADQRTGGLADKLDERLKTLIEFENVLMC